MGNPGKEQMPKISGEFKPAPPPGRPAPQPVRPAPAAPPRPAQAGARAPQPVAARPPQPVAARPPQQAARAPQPVTKPAPMAPRTPQASGARPVTPIPQGAPGLGDRLRAERQAAEKLADQRVAQARGRNGDRPGQPPVNVTPAQKPAPKAPEKPKFSFSAEELAKDKREQVPPEREFPTFSAKSSTATPPPPLTPPRPALGGGAGAQAQQPRQPIQAPPVRQQPPKPAATNPPPGAAFQPRFNGPAQPSGGNYRSLDPPPGGAFAPKPKPYADTAFRDDPLANRQPANREYDSYRRGLPQAPQPAYGDDSGPSLGDYRRRQQVPARTRQPGYDEDVNEVFEDEEPQRPPRRRASAQDYNRAYRDYEDGYDTETPRRRGPWPWLAAIAALGLIAAGIIYYYLTYIKGSGQVTGNVPVIEAPEQSSKSAPEPASGSTLGTQGAIQPDAADKTKKIYDRILGDEEVDGNQVVPTQEEPQIVEPTGSNEEQNTAPASDLPSGSGDNANEPLPLPLPPPGEQGALPSNASQQTAALGTTTTTDQKSVPEPASTNTANTVDTGAPVPGQLQKSTEPAADPPLPQIETSPPQIEQVVSTPEPVPQKPAKPKARAEKKPAKKVVAAVEDVGAEQNNGVAPLVLVPPAQSGNAEAQTQPPIAQPVDQAANPETVQPTEEKSKSFFGFGSTKRKLTGKAAEQANAQGAAGNWSNSPDPNATVGDASGLPATTPEQQVASVAPEPIPLPAPEPAPQQAKPAAGGFVAQLASFRSEAEAMAEFDRLRAKHGDVLGGLSPRVVKANIGGSTRYRLGVGPLASRSAALKICNSLISAGERDCLVRGN